MCEELALTLDQKGKGQAKHDEELDGLRTQLSDSVCLLCPLCLSLLLPLFPLVLTGQEGKCKAFGEQLKKAEAALKVPGLSVFWVLTCLCLG